MKKDIPRIGNILEMYVTISFSLLYIYPQILRSRVMVNDITSPSDKAMYMTTFVAIFAA
jgi:hypothetical protein